MIDAARTIELFLLDARHDRNARLSRRYSDLMTRSSDLLVDRDGYVLDGAELANKSPFDIPKVGGELVLGDGSLAVAVPLGRGEAYLLRRHTTRTGLSAPAAKGLERAEGRARELATEQAALRQVATLVARESSPDQLFAVVAEQVAQIFDVPHVRLVRYEPDGSLVVGGFSEGDHEPFPIGSRWPMSRQGVVETVRQQGRPARVEDYEKLTGEISAVARGAGMRSAVASPIVVERHLWGAIVVLTPRREPLPEDTEARLADFTELVATAIANAESRTELAASEARAHELATEQAALRRVATLVARGGRPEPVFRAVADEAVALLGCDKSVIVRFEHDGTATVMGAHDTRRQMGERIPLDPYYVLAAVHRTGKPARLDTDDPAAEGVTESARTEGLRSALASPVVVDGHLWGAIAVGSLDHSLPAITERRLADFTDLVATAVANAHSGQQVRALAAEQAALRRVATLVAQDAAPPEVFAAVSAEVDRVFGLDPATVDVAGVVRFEPGPELVVVGVSKRVEAIPLGLRFPPDELSAPTHVLRTARSARVRSDDVEAAVTEVADFLRHHGYACEVASPIVVDGHLWGAVSVNSRNELPPDTEERLEKFTRLVATAIANAEGSAELAASRKRIVAASDDARRRIERNLHDGVQQQLVSLGLKLGAMKADPPTGAALKEQLAVVSEDVDSVLDALVEIARGIHPAILAHGGLAAALKALARRSAVPVELEARIEGPLPDEVEVGAYYVAAEALTNTAKHARASVVQMEVTTDDGTLTLMVRDDGVGGADPGGGSGLVGLQDRVKALGGAIEIDSSLGSGTCVVVTLPIAMEPDPAL